MKPLFTIIGTVKKGAQKGREFGYPTANVSLTSHIPEGVYAARVHIDGKEYNAGTFIGSAPTFGDDEYKSESNIYDFSEEIYGREITVILYKKIRGNIKFNDEKSLIAQMSKDTEAIKNFLKNI